MSWARPAARLLMVVTFLVAALALAPTGALAHAGHNHAVQPETAIALESVSVQKFSVAPVSTQSVTTGTVQAFADLVPTGSQKKSQNCVGGCCSGSMGCCAAWFEPPMELLVPVIGRLTLNTAVSGGAGITPDALPEPPKFLV
jgi:hypothetical protein